MPFITELDTGLQVIVTKKYFESAFSYRLFMVLNGSRL